MATLADILGGLGGVGGGILQGQRLAGQEQARRAQLQMQQEFRRMQLKALAQQARDRGAAQTESIAARKAAEQRLAQGPFLETLFGTRSSELVPELAQQGQLEGYIQAAKARGVDPALTAGLEAKLRAAREASATAPAGMEQALLGAILGPGVAGMASPRAEMAREPRLSLEEATEQQFPRGYKAYLKGEELKLKQGANLARIGLAGAQKRLAEWNVREGLALLPGKVKLQGQQVNKLIGEIALNVEALKKAPLE
ncbi:MAG: hypothetical protein ACREJI_07175, partial [Candidatus Methylomirabilales bacterium]